MPQGMLTSARQREQLDRPMTDKTAIATEPRNADARECGSWQRGWLGMPTVMAIITAGTLLAGPTAAGELTGAGDGVSLGSGVLVDPTGTILYVAEPEGLTARRLQDGERVWRHEPSARPLGLHAGSLVALGQSATEAGFEVHYLAPATGAVQASIEVPLPDGINFLLQDRPDQRFRLRYYAGDEGEILSWTHARRPLRGAPAVSGLNRGRKMPRISTEGSSPTESETEAEAEAGAWQQRVGGLVQLDRSSEQALPLPSAFVDRLPVELSPDLAPDEWLGEIQGRQFRSGDGRHVLATRTVDDPTEWLRHEWILLDRDSGSALGSLQRFYSYAPFVVVERQIALLVPAHGQLDKSGQWVESGPALAVWRLDDDVLSWRTELLETAYLGELPP